MYWEDLAAKDFLQTAKECGRVCILPIGVIEKHGDHLPLGTDMYIARAAATAAAKKSPAVIFPYYYLGQIAEAVHVAGTVAASHRLIMDALLEICDEIHRNGFTKILILNGHGGNMHFLPFFAQMMPKAGREYAVYVHFAHNYTDEQTAAIDKRTGGRDMGAHAGLAETSLMMHIRPDLVDMGQVVVAESEALGRLAALHGTGVDAFTPWFWYADYPHHFAGDPAGSTAELGEFLLDYMTENTVNLLRAIKADEVTGELIRGYVSTFA